MFAKSTKYKAPKIKLCYPLAKTILVIIPILDMPGLFYT